MKHQHKNNIQNYHINSNKKTTINIKRILYNILIKKIFHNIYNTKHQHKNNILIKKIFHNIYNTN